LYVNHINLSLPRGEAQVYGYLNFTVDS